MEWLAAHDISIAFCKLMWGFWIVLHRFFGKGEMFDFNDFEANVDDIVDNDNDEVQEPASGDSVIDDFIDDETQIDDNWRLFCIYQCE